MSASTKRSSSEAELPNNNQEQKKKQCIQGESSKLSETNKDKGDEVPKPYEWPSDESYYEAEWQDYKDWKDEEEGLAREQPEQPLIQPAIGHEEAHVEEEHVELPRLFLFDDNEDAEEAYFSEDDVFEGLDYDDAHLAFDREKSPKFYF